MSTATLTQKGQITIPFEVRQKLDLKTGDRILFVAIGHGRYKVLAVTNSVTELKAMFGKFSGEASSSAELDALTHSLDKRLAPLLANDAGSRLRGVMRGPAKLGGKVKVGG